MHISISKGRERERVSWKERYIVKDEEKCFLP